MIKLIARQLLRLVPRGTVIPILSGPLRGCRWIIGAGTHGCWLGTYERDKQKLFARSIQPGATVYDIGANVGFYTLLAARLVGRTGTVESFEPFPLNMSILNRHLELNGFDNVHLHEVAVSGTAGVCRFASGQSPETGKLDADGDLKVNVIGIDEAVAAGRIPPPNVVKIDVEGAEGNVLMGAKATLRRDRPLLFIAIHGSSVLRNVQASLDECQYEVSVEAGGGDGLFEVYARPLSCGSVGPGRDAK